MAALGAYLTTLEAAERLGVGQSRVYQLIEQGRLKAKRIGGRLLLIEVASVRSFKRLPRGRPRKKAPEKKGGHRRAKK